MYYLTADQGGDAIRIVENRIEISFADDFGNLNGTLFEWKNGYDYAVDGAATNTSLHVHRLNECIGDFDKEITPIKQFKGLVSDDESREASRIFCNTRANIEGAFVPIEVENINIRLFFKRQ